MLDDIAGTLTSRYIATGGKLPCVLSMNTPGKLIIEQFGAFMRGCSKELGVQLDENTQALLSESRGWYFVTTLVADIAEAKVLVKGV